MHAKRHSIRSSDSKSRPVFGGRRATLEGRPLLEGLIVFVWATSSSSSFNLLYLTRLFGLPNRAGFVGRLCLSPNRKFRLLFGFDRTSGAGKTSSLFAFNWLRCRARRTKVTCAGDHLAMSVERKRRLAH